MYLRKHPSADGVLLIVLMADVAQGRQRLWRAWRGVAARPLVHVRGTCRYKTFFLATLLAIMCPLLFGPLHNAPCRVGVSMIMYTADYACVQIVL